MTNLRQQLLDAGLVTAEAARRSEERARKPERTLALGQSRRAWIAEYAKRELFADPTSATARRLIAEAHEKFDDGSEEFRRWLRPLYELRDQLDELDREDRAQLICRAFRKSGRRFDVRNDADDGR